MESNLKLLYDYVQDLEYLIKKANELAKKSNLKDELSKFQAIETFDFENLSLRETEQLISLSRILVDYGFSQTYESFENACLLLLADYNRTKEAVDMAVEKLKKSTSRLYAGKTEADFLWKAHEVDNPWALLVEMLAKGNNEATARRNFYLKRIAGLANLESLANITLSKESDEIAYKLSPLLLETSFVINDGISPEILSLHASKTDLS